MIIVLLLISLDAQTITCLFFLPLIKLLLPILTPVLFSTVTGVFNIQSKIFKQKLDDIGAIQSMSRVSRCIDNGPMEGFWEIIKSEMYYLQRFHDFDELGLAIERYMHFYNNRRLQEKLKGLTPIEFRNQTLVA